MTQRAGVADGAPPSRDLLRQVVKAYDVRGTVPDQLDASLAHALGNAFAGVLTEDAGTPPRAVVVGHDMRPSSPELVDAFAEGVVRAGVDVVLLGLSSTDELYFASGSLDVPGAMFTASHNPAQYNGIKLCRAGAAPVSRDSGLALLAERVATGDVRRGPRPGSVTRRDVLPAYAAHLHALVPVAGRRLRVVVDAGNGMAGLTAPAVLGPLDLDLVPLYFELDGTFPHHEANPIDPANLRDLQRAVLAERADVGLAFDGDADRCFAVDEQGRPVDPSALTALIATRELRQHPGAPVIHNLITSRAVPEIVAEHGGRPVRTRVGHSFIKQTMAETGAVFGGEHSGHYYFRDFWRADSGMLAALHLLAALATTPAPLSAVLAPFQRYVASGEINSEVADAPGTLDRVRARYEDRDDVAVDTLDGVTVTHADWWFNVRPSNTEPLVRLNAEGGDQATMTSVRDEVLEFIRSDA